MVSRCGFDAHFPDGGWRWCLSLFADHLYVHLRKISIQALCLFLNWIRAFVVELYTSYILAY